MNNTQPTPENVSPEYRLLIRPALEADKQRGAIVTIFGGSPCPWCNNDMESVELGSLIAVCKQNPTHIVKWIPWGG